MYSTIRRFVERGMLGDIVKDLSERGELDNLPDWFWESLFEYFTHE